MTRGNLWDGRVQYRILAVPIVSESGQSRNSLFLEPPVTQNLTYRCPTSLSLTSLHHRDLPQVYESDLNGSIGHG